VTAIAVILTCVVFLTIDYFRSRKRVVQPAGKLKAKTVSPIPRLQPPVVAGFELPDHFRYHPGHTWALSESPTFVRVGLDSFAARLAGEIQNIILPARGQWIRQGQKLATIFRDGSKADLVSPIEGEVTGVNEAVLKDPKLASHDPYGEGWLLTVHSPDASTNFRNLLGGALARKWMEEAANRLRMRMPTLAGAVAQDGGVAVDDLVAHLPEQEWKELTAEFFLI